MNRVPYRRITPSSRTNTYERHSHSRHGHHTSQETTVTSGETIIVQCIISGILLVAVLLIGLLDIAPTTILRDGINDILNGPTTVAELTYIINPTAPEAAEPVITEPPEAIIIEPTTPEPETYLPIIPLPEIVPLSAELWNPLWINPLYGPISSPSGIRFSPITGRPEFHDGIDIAVPIGTPVAAPRDGYVLAVGYSPSFGRVLRLTHDDGYISFFAHLNSIAVRTGDRVQQGETIAYSGNTGWSTGPHLHFSLFRNGQFVDPIDYVDLYVRR